MDTVISRPRHGLQNVPSIVLTSSSQAEMTDSGSCRKSGRKTVRYAAVVLFRGLNAASQLAVKYLRRATARLEAHGLGMNSSAYHLCSPES